MRILLVSYYFPPFNSVGAVRPVKLARWLRAQGHDVHVLACSNQPFPEGLSLEVPRECITAVPSWSVNAPVEWLLGGRRRVAERGYDIGKTDSSLGKALGLAYKTLVHWPDGQLGWVRRAIRAGRVLLSQHRFDLIYASAPPFSVLRVAARLSSGAAIPWVAELRDLWTDNHAYAFPAWRRFIERRWESSLFSSASALVTVSGPLADKLSRHGRPVLEVRNGYDPDDEVDPAGLAATWPEGLRLAYTGSVYPHNNDLDAFCAGLSEYLNRGGDARLIAVGRNLSALERASRRYGVVQAVEIHASLPRARALGLQRSADVLVMFLWQGASGIYTTKFFEYVGAGRPILAIGPRNGDIASWIIKDSLGHVAQTPQEVFASLVSLAAEKAACAGRSGPSPPANFTRDAQFSKLNPLLASLRSGEG